MSRYLLASLAETDVDAVWLPIAMNNRDAVKRMLAPFTDVFEKLAEYPLLGELLACVSNNLRQIVISPYVIVYRIEKGEIVVTRALHGARKWENLIW